MKTNAYSISRTDDGGAIIVRQDGTTLEVAGGTYYELVRQRSVGHGGVSSERYTKRAADMDDQQLLDVVLASVMPADDGKTATHITIRLTPAERATLESLRVQLGQRHLADVVRLGIRTLAQREEREEA